MNILLYCKNTEANVRAIEIAVEQATAFSASVQLVSCISEKPGVPIEVTRETEQKQKQKLQDFIRDYFQPKAIACNAETLITQATAGEEIVKYATKINADAVIMSIQKRSKIGKMVFGSNSQFIILEAPCKVITVK